MSLRCVRMFAVPPLTSHCYSPWARGPLIVSISFSLKRHSSGCDGFQLPVLTEPAVWK